MKTFLSHLKHLFLDDESARACSLLASGGVYWKNPTGLTVARDASVVHLDSRQAKQIAGLLPIRPTLNPSHLRALDPGVARLCRLDTNPL